MVQFSVFSTDLLDDEVESVFKLSDCLARRWELDDLGVFFGEATAVSLDNVVVGLRVKGLAQLNRQVDIGLMVHKDVLQTKLLCLV